MKVWSQKNLEDIRHEYIDFDGEWYLAFGRPEKSGCWIIYGKSGQGKSSFALQLARKFDEMGLRVLYLTLEMGACDDFVNSVLSVGIHSKTNNIIYSDEATITELDEYLSKQRSPDVIMIDSIQYFEQQGGESPRNNPPAQEVSAKDICLYLACGRARGGRKNRL